MNFSKIYFAFIICLSLTSCSSDYDVASSEQEIINIELEEIPCNKEDVKTAFIEHFNLSRSLKEDINITYDFSKTKKIKVADENYFYLVPNIKNSSDFLMGIPQNDEIPYILKVCCTEENKFTISNEFDEIICTNEYNTQNNIFTLSSSGENDVITISSRASLAGIICSVGIEAVCYYSCSAAGITGGWSLLVGCCGAVASYLVCP